MKTSPCLGTHPGVRLGQNLEGSPAVAARGLPEAQEGRGASSNLRQDDFEKPPALEQPFLIVHPGHGSDIAWRPTENQLLQVSGVIAQDVYALLPPLGNQAERVVAVHRHQSTRKRSIKLI